MKTDLDRFLDQVARFQRRRTGGSSPTALLKDTCTVLHHFFDQARKDAAEGHARMQVAAPPTGSGKSTATLVYAAHLWRTRRQRTVILVPTIRMADAMYREARLLFDDPGEYADTINVFTTAHRTDISPRTRQAACEDHGLLRDNPAITLSQLPDWPILIVTQNFWMDKHGHMATEGRSLIVLDEWTGKVETHLVRLGELDSLRDWYDRKTPAIAPEGSKISRDRTSRDLQDIAIALRTAYSGMKESGKAGRYLPLTTDKVEAVARVADRWRNERESLAALADPTGYCGAEPLREWLDRLFGFIAALDKGQVFKVRHHQDVGYGSAFMGYSVKYEIQPGIVLLDATGRLDGVSQIVNWRDDSCTEVPVVDYGDLQPFIVDKPAALVTPKPRAASAIAENQGGCLEVWVDWVRWLIDGTLGDAERALVICPRKLLNHVPADLKAALGDRLSLTSWGHHVGSNEWKDVDVVYLLDEFHRPRDMHIAHVRGLQGDEESRRPTEENLQDAQSVLLKGDYEAYRDGQLLAAFVQGASRGRLRQVDEHGRCLPMLPPLEN
ncbi:DEAD/DEAH box helicase family protein [Acuticoccus mangrovi]|uniref:DEAD/DEAH box helicase family protein n=1 Tax=Acuticoccus mangrovi TaxID=2796142 RepID=A0A934IU56_9HYPH|nr:DEAD/DEAH box helicase family protein [Acuticoccus mangrovi]MBJ3778896.1 DEAD/DEAH box helicase family protein [Acuticoccus mangrovi]